MKKKVNEQTRLLATLLGLALFGSAVSQMVSAGTTVLELKQLYGADLRVAGLIERINVKSNTFVVSGQVVVIDNSTTFAEGGEQRRSPGLMRGLLSLHLGDYVVVNGSIDSPAVSVTRLSDQYVSGSSTIYVHGTLTTIDSTTGIGKLGGLRVDLTPAMSDSNVAGIQSGEVLEVSGTQPVSNGVLLTDIVVADQSTKSIVGTSGAHSIVGTSGANSIVGTSGAHSIVGTSGANSIVGTSGAHSIAGS